MSGESSGEIPGEIPEQQGPKISKKIAPKIPNVKPAEPPGSERTLDSLTKDPKTLPQRPTGKEEYLSTLKRENPDYDYEGITGAMAQKALAWAREKGVDSLRLSAAQIILSQDYIPGEKTGEEIARELQLGRIQKIRDNRENLLPILSPARSKYFHATDNIETAETIMKEGLYADLRSGLNGSAIEIKAVPPDADQATREQIIENNMQELANPHRGYRYEVIIDLPDLTAEQIADLQTRELKGEPIHRTACFVQKLPEKAGVIGVGIIHDGVLPTQYIKGYLDLDTGQFIPKTPLT